MSLRVLEAVRDELIECEAVSSGREFCQSWLAKDESYLRVLRFHQTDPSADALAICASKLGYYALRLEQSEQPSHKDWANRFIKLRSQCLHAIEMQARAKWMTPERMGT
jgi:hypothetical protein